MNDESKMIDRIEALFRKAYATEFEEERDAFLTKARELLDKYKIEEHRLDLERGVTQSVESARIVLSGKNQLRQVYIYWALEDFFYVRCLHSSGYRSWRGDMLPHSVEVYGYEKDVELFRVVAQAVIDQMFTGATAAALKYKADYPDETLTKTFYTSYYRGFELGVGKKVRDAMAERNKTAEIRAIVISSNAAIELVFNGMELGTHRRQGTNLDSDAYMAGYKDGQQANLNRMIGDTK